MNSLKFYEYCSDVSNFMHTGVLLHNVQKYLCTYAFTKLEKGNMKFTFIGNSKKSKDLRKYIGIRIYEISIIWKKCLKGTNLSYMAKVRTSTFSYLKNAFRENIIIQK